ncbi:MAG: FtsX-like permease family protein, partial [Gemmatimonadetes bacterium]|nr:FtsX-like permease family protein [Gemmatimonadota bacterium]
PAVTGVRLEPLNGLPRMARGPFIGFMGLLFATAGLVLCIAASNVAGMLLARATYRRGEMAVRLAVGAGRGRIIRQLLTETLALCAIGGAAGTVLAYWITTLVPAIQPPIGIRTAFDVSLDRRVLLVAAGITMLTGLLAGIAPAVHTTGRDPIATLRGTGVAPAVSSRARNLFVGAQLAMSLVLLVAAGLFVRALQRGLAVDPGLDATGVVMGSLNLGPRGYDATRTRLFVDQLLDRLNGRPEIAAAAVGQWGPLSGPYRSVGVPRPVQGGGETSLPVWYGTAGVGYLELLKVPVVTGRTFTAADRAETEPVLIVNQTMARALWPGGSAVGETIYLAGARRVVVGVVRDGRYRSLDEAPMAFAFLPYAQYAGTEVTVYARARGAVEDALLALRREVAALDPDVALEQPRSLASQIAFLLLPQRIAAGFIGAFGLVGLLLAAIGVYGVLAFHVAQRTREFGLRLALGATPGDLIRQVLRQGSGIMLAGGAAGLVLALHSAACGMPPASPPRRC